MTLDGFSVLKPRPPVVRLIGPLQDSSVKRMVEVTARFMYNNRLVMDAVDHTRDSDLVFSASKIDEYDLVVFFVNGFPTPVHALEFYITSEMYSKTSLLVALGTSKISSWLSDMSNHQLNTDNPKVVCEWINNWIDEWYDERP